MRIATGSLICASTCASSIRSFPICPYTHPTLHYPPIQARGGTDGAALFRATFGCFVGAIVAWIADIAACDELQQLPLGLPYPQLHAFGWHFGTTLGLLQLFCLMLLHQHTVRDGLEAQVRWRFAGIVPVLLATAHEL